MSEPLSQPTATPREASGADPGAHPDSLDQRSAAPPNYAARRMLVTTIAITAIIAAAVVAWRYISTEESTAAGARGEWSEIALVDRTTGTITRLDPEGQLIDTTIGLGRVTDVHVSGERMALVGSDRIVLAAPNVESVTIPIERTSRVVPIHTPGRLHLAIGTPTGGNVLLVDATTGEILDVGAIAGQTSPRYFVEKVRWAADASAFAVADAINFQTIVVRPGEPDPIFLPDQPVAVAGGLAATSQVVGSQADIALLDFERRNQAFVPTEIPAGGILDDDRLVMVSVDGGIYRVDKGADEADRMGAIAVPAGAAVGSVHPIANGGRLVANGQVFQAVVDLEGKTLFTTSFPTPTALPRPSSEWACLPVGATEAAFALIDVSTGEQLADLTNTAVVGTSSDGCAVLGERNGVYELIDADQVVRLGSARAAVLAPDGRTVVRMGVDGRTEIIVIDDDFELSETIDISTQASTNTTAVFLDR